MSTAVAAAAAALLAAVFAPQRLDGVLVAADFVHRVGQFRTPAGEARDFTLPPEGVVTFRGADADLRDVPLGTPCEFTLAPGAGGDFTRLAQVRDRLRADPDATGRQRRSHAAFLKARGLPGRVERAEGRTLTVALFGGDPEFFVGRWLPEFATGRGVRVAVANDELRTWNPPVDQESGKVVEARLVAAEGTGDAGVRLTVTVGAMLEGFRRGRVVRLFAGEWPSLDQPFGEQLFHYGNRALPAELAESPPKEYPGQFPFRTDHGNRHLPWHQPRPGVAPPPHSEHAVWGELAGPGRFLADRTGATVGFTLLPEASVRYLGAASGLAAVPAGTRCRFGLHPDAAGAFTRASSVTDGVSDMAADGVVWRVTALAVGAGTLTAARQPPAVRNDQGDPEQPPDTGRAELRVDAGTRVWKAGRWGTPGDLAVGDRLLVNRGGERPGHPSACTHVWANAAPLKLAAAPASTPATRDRR